MCDCDCELSRWERWRRVQREVQLAGPGEAALTLGVSIQRLHELRKLAEFPVPLAVLASGPVWLLEDLEAYDRVRNKKPGPRRR